MIGEEIKKFRKNHGLDHKALSNLTGIDKSVIWKIETGQTKNPKYKTIREITQGLRMPFAVVIENFSTNKPDEAMNILTDALNQENPHLIQETAKRYLETEHIVTEEAIRLLFDLAKSIDNNFSGDLYEAIIVYTRERGMPKEHVDALIEKYLIDRDDFSKLEQTYLFGRNILDYTNLITDNVYQFIHYKLGVHAYNLSRFEECIYLCDQATKKGQDEKIKANSIYAIINSYYYLGQYQKAEGLLDKYACFNFPEINNNIKMALGAIETKKGNYAQAKGLLEECLKNSSPDSLIHLLNHLITLYLALDDDKSIENIFRLEEKALQFCKDTPFKRYEIANFHRKKGDYYLNAGDMEAGMESYIQAAVEYGKVSMHKLTNECMLMLYKKCSHYIKKSNGTVLNKLEVAYNSLVSP